jgi:hypothetical protein
VKVSVGKLNEVTPEKVPEETKFNPALVAIAVFICAVVEYAVKSVCAEASSCHAVPS